MVIVTAMGIRSARTRVRTALSIMSCYIALKLGMLRAIHRKHFPRNSCKYYLHGFGSLHRLWYLRLYDLVKCMSRPFRNR